MTSIALVEYSGNCEFNFVISVGSLSRCWFVVFIVMVPENFLDIPLDKFRVCYRITFGQQNEPPQELWVTITGVATASQAGRAFGGTAPGDFFPCFSMKSTIIR